MKWSSVGHSVCWITGSTDSKGAMLSLSQRMARQVSRYALVDEIAEIK